MTPTDQIQTGEVAQVASGGVVAKASANIALIKYWGKSDAATNLPAVESLSITLAGLDTVTVLEPMLGSACMPTGDVIELGGKLAQGDEERRIREFLNLFRALENDSTHFHVRSTNHFPTAAGLASSASGFAALGAAAASFYGWGADRLHELANLVRQGSGSAPRSLLGGFVHLVRNESDIDLRSISSRLYDDMAVVVGVTSAERKSISSRAAMQRCTTSPYWDRWLTAQPEHLARALPLLEAADFNGLGAVAELNAQAMHALCHTAEPPVYYWNGQSAALLQLAAALRGDGWPVYTTMDAGPQVKFLCLRTDVPRLVATIEEKVSGVRTIVTYPGPGALG